MKTLENKKIFSIQNMILGILLIIFLIIPGFASNNYIISILVTCFIFAALGVAWNIIGGYGAQISWCHSSFVAIGAYSNFILSTSFNLSPFLSLPLGIIISVVFATIVGYGTFRLRGAYFSIATIAFAESLRISLQYFDKLTKGAAGIYVTYRGHSFWELTFDNDIPFYYIALALLIVITLITYRFTKSRTGYYLGAIKGDEDAAESLGIEAFRVKLRAFQLSAIITSVVGAIYASFLTYIAPTSTAGFDLSIKIGVVAIVGGLGTIWGPVLGAFIIIPLIEFANVLLGQYGGGNMLYGLLLILIVIFKPTGIISLFDRSHKKKEDSNKEKKVIIDKGGL